MTVLSILHVASIHLVICRDPYLRKTNRGMCWGAIEDGGRASYQNVSREKIGVDTFSRPFNSASSITTTHS